MCGNRLVVTWEAGIAMRTERRYVDLAGVGGAVVLAVDAYERRAFPGVEAVLLWLLIAVVSIAATASRKRLFCENCSFSAPAIH
jgi:hypothetical protein